MKPVKNRKQCGECLQLVQPPRGRTNHMYAQAVRHLRMLALTFVVGLAGVAVLTGSANAAIPAPPAGFTLTWSDDFSGASGTGLSSANWLYDTGTGIFGTGEIETMTNS